MIKKKEKGGSKMEISEVNLTIIQNVKKKQDDDFFKELLKGYLEAEISKKRELLKEYLIAYDKLEDKNSFNAQYLETLIAVLRDEI